MTTEYKTLVLNDNNYLLLLKSDIDESIRLSSIIDKAVHSDDDLFFSFFLVAQRAKDLIDTRLGCSLARQISFCGL
jgi:hypothetical protein